MPPFQMQRLSFSEQAAVTVPLKGILRGLESHGNATDAKHGGKSRKGQRNAGERPQERAGRDKSGDRGKQSRKTAERRRGAAEGKGEAVGACLAA